MRYVTAGESHGAYLTAIVDDVPAGIPIDEHDINADLRRRSGSYGRSERQQMEDDRVIITGGVIQGVTTGAPVSLMIENACNHKQARNVRPRPGHADLVGAQKFGFDECSVVTERASARETAARVAAAGIAKAFLAQLGISITSFTTSIGEVSLGGCEATYVDAPYSSEQIELSPVRCPDKTVSEHMVACIDEIREQGTTLGGTFSVVLSGLPCGLGGYAQGCDRLGSQIGAAMLSVPSVKGVSFGAGFGSAAMIGCDYADEIILGANGLTRTQNNNGGLEGGMTNGMPLVVHAACKPVPTMQHPSKTVDMETWEPVEASIVRSDVCIVPSAAVIAEGEVAFVVARALMKKFGSDSLDDIKAALQAYNNRLVSSVG